MLRRRLSIRPPSSRRGESRQVQQIWYFAHVAPGAVIGENCSLGQNTYVERNAIVGNACRLGNSVSIFPTSSSRISFSARRTWCSPISRFRVPPRRANRDRTRTAPAWFAVPDPAAGASRVGWSGDFCATRIARGRTDNPVQDRIGAAPRRPYPCPRHRSRRSHRAKGQNGTHTARSRSIP